MIGVGRRQIGLREIVVTLLCVMMAVCLAYGRLERQEGGVVDRGIGIVGQPVGRSDGGEAFSGRVLELVNQERVRFGLGLLGIDRRAEAVAMGKSREMYERNYFDHVSPYSGDLPQQFERFGGIILGQGYSSIGENIAWMRGYTLEEISAELLMEKWMASPGHRENILNAAYTHMGTAVCFGEKGAFAAQEFVAAD